MKPNFRQLAVIACYSALLPALLVACGRKDNSIEPPGNGSAPVASSSSNPLPGVIPVPTPAATVPGGNTGAGPAHGNTAIGGVNSQQGAGTAAEGTPSTPTAGDGSSSGASK